LGEINWIRVIGNYLEREDNIRVHIDRNFQQTSFRLDHK